MNRHSMSDLAVNDRAVNDRSIGRFVISMLLMFTPSAFATTLYVGTCHTPSYNTISAAVAAAPAGAIIDVCPGRYPEQIVITQAVTLRGIASNNGDQAIVVAPPNGMVVNAEDDMGDAIAAQLLVSPGPPQVSNLTSDVNPGPVGISNLTFDASNNEVSEDAYVVGIFLQNSAATVKGVVTQNQIGGDGGVGIWIEGGSANPKVTVEDCSIHDFNDIGIWTQTNAAAPQLTAVVEDNFVNGETASGVIGIIDVALGLGSSNTVSDNYLASGKTGITISGAAEGAVAHNNLINDGTAIAIGGDGRTGGNISVTSNNTFESSVEGIIVNSGLPAVQHNTIANAPVGIDYACNGDGNMKLNTIIDVGIGAANLPAGFAAVNTFYNVQTENASCGAAVSAARK